MHCGGRGGWIRMEAGDFKVWKSLFLTFFFNYSVNVCVHAGAHAPWHVFGGQRTTLGSWFLLISSLGQQSLVVGVPVLGIPGLLAVVSRIFPALPLISTWKICSYR